MSAKVKPKPVHITVCAECGQPWSTHERSALARLKEHYLDPDEDDVAKEICARDCLLALKARNRGPEGPPGPQGPRALDATGRA
jgi:hypothetical protein